ncbi:STAS domain-containing protein [Streptomyces sp. NPDC059009]|uniref:STAS domain-containing protein n=1 Tax=Streptomyces sp. NPDC059009 TaxID=3346694 RepID=UPI0036C7E3E7
MSFHASFGIQGAATVLSVAGEVTDADIRELRAVVDAAVAQRSRRLVIDLYEATQLAPAAVRCLAFAQQQLPAGAQIVVEGAAPHLRHRLTLAGLDRSMTIVAAPALATAA